MAYEFNRGFNKIRLALPGAALFIALVALGLLFWKDSQYKKAIDELEWSQAVSDHNSLGNSISPEVGVIQFLNHGYSIALESVNYNADGMHISGYVGNPLSLSLTNLTLKFTASKPFYSGRDKFFQMERGSIERMFYAPEEIGSAQSSPIFWLGAGKREMFSVTIPNVKQTKEEVEIRVEFKGERYSY
jgi:hypothetical protein